VRAAVLRYRVMAYVTGVVLIILCFVGIPLQIVAGNETVVNDVGTLHGILYIIYLIFAYPYYCLLVKRRHDRNNNGLDVIITDHHLPDEKEGAPPAFAVLNPNQAGCTYPDKNLAGVGVAFKLVHALFREYGREAQVPAFMKVVAIGTVAARGGTPVHEPERR